MGAVDEYEQILEAEDEFNKRITDLVISMSDIVVYVVDVEQFATIAQLIKVIKEVNVLIGRAIDFFKKHKERGILGEYSPIDLVHSFTYIKTQISEGALCVFGRGAGRARRPPDRL